MPSGLPRINPGDNHHTHTPANPPLVKVSAGKCESCDRLIDTNGQCGCSG